MQSNLFARAMFCLILGANSANPANVEPLRSGQETSISRAIFVHSQLWMLTDAGALSSITEGEAQQNNIALPEPAFDLWVQEGEPAVLTGERDGSSWTLRRWLHGAWEITGKIAANKNEAFVGIISDGQKVIVLTSDRLVAIEGTHQRTVALKWPNKTFAGITTIKAVSDSLLVGFNIGEWGGGLRRIDRETGQITIVERKDGKDFCSGPLDTACDPVNGIAVSPWRPKCAIIAIGLVHFIAHGSLVEVCNGSIVRLYSKAYGNDRISTVPFFGLTEAKGSILAVGADGIYKIEPSGAAQVRPFPEFEKIGNVSVSFSDPEVVFLLTSVNQRRSVSGSTPIMIAR
jgi:hypothetical protein